MTETDSQPIAENEQVKELLALLKDNNTPGYEEFSKLIEHVTGMEQRLLEATEELKAVRQEMQGLQNHSLKDALQKSYTAMEANISVMRHRLSELKGQIINGCRNILADFRERGTVALNGITQFLHVRPVLESIQSAAEKSMQASNRAVARIDAFSTEYHEMGRHFKNMGRMNLCVQSSILRKCTGPVPWHMNGGMDLTIILVQRWAQKVCCQNSPASMRRSKNSLTP